MQVSYDTFMALKHNITDTKMSAVLFHRICGNFDEARKAYFTDAFKQLKQWLFGTYRTASIPSNTYITTWKAWTLFQKTKNSRLVTYEKYYDQPLTDFYPEEDYMYVSSKPITEPVYYMCKPTKKILQAQEDKMEIVEAVVEKDVNGIPYPASRETSFVPVKNFFEYMFRNFNCDNLGCEWCRNQLSPASLEVTLECSHFIHRTCVEASHTCPVCKYY